MTGAVCGAVLAVALFAIAAPRLGGHLPPALATRLLVPASLVMAASTLFVLAVLALTWLGQLPAVAAIGPWSASRLDATDPFPDYVAAASGVLLVAATTRAVIRVIRRVRGLVSVCRTYRGVPSAGSVIVVDSPDPDAFATPAPVGRVVVTSALLRALTQEEQRVVLAHERSHLVHKHVWWTMAADLAAAVNPFLRPTATTVGRAVERWADEDAAAAVGDRRQVARAIARAALLKHDARGSVNALAPAATGGDVPHRVRALLAAPPRRRPVAFAAVAVLLMAGALATIAVERSSDQLFDRAAVGAANTHVAGER